MLNRSVLFKALFCLFFIFMILMLIIFVNSYALKFTDNSNVLALFYLFEKKQTCKRILINCINDLLIVMCLIFKS